MSTCSIVCGLMPSFAATTSNTASIPVAPGDHGAHEALVAGHVDQIDFRVRPDLQVGEAERDGYAALLLLRKSVGILARQGANQRGLAVIDMPDHAEHETPHAWTTESLLVEPYMLWPLAGRTRAAWRTDRRSATSSLQIAAHRRRRYAGVGEGKLRKTISMSMQSGRYTAARPLSLAQGWNLKRLTQPSRLFGANGLRTGPDGRIYVAQVSGSQISAIDVQTGAIEAISPNGRRHRRAR